MAVAFPSADDLPELRPPIPSPACCCFCCCCQRQLCSCFRRPPPQPAASRWGPFSPSPSCLLLITNFVSFYIPCWWTPLDTADCDTARCAMACCKCVQVTMVIFVILACFWLIAVEKTETVCYWLHKGNAIQLLCSAYFQFWIQF
jgi:hypothetical protein